MKSNHDRYRLRQGFTLIELMVAMAITFLIVGILVTITGSAMDTWTRSRDELRAARQAKTMINLMASDFESMVTRPGLSDEWLSAVSNLPVEGGSTNAANLVFFTCATDRYEGQVGVEGMDKGGDVSCVGYQLQWNDPITGTSESGKYNTFVLKRHLVDPNHTFTELLGNTATDALDNLYLNTYAAQLDESNTFVCENILQFTMIFHVENNANGVIVNTLVPIRAGEGTQELRIKGNALTLVPDAPNLVGGSVTAVEVALSVASDPGIVQLRQNPELSTDAKWMQRNTYQYSKLIQLPRK